jgi:hypothetical protein
LFEVLEKKLLITFFKLNPLRVQIFGGKIDISYWIFVGQRLNKPLMLIVSPWVFLMIGMENKNVRIIGKCSPRCQNAAA